MTKPNLIRFTKSAVLTSALCMAFGTAHAQSTEEVVGAVIGGAGGTYAGGELDNKGSKIEGQIIGGIAGGVLGYVIGGKLDNDDKYRRRYDNRAGEYYTYEDRGYRRYPNEKYGYVSFPVRDNDPYYYLDGRKKDHPVFAEHPGQGKGKGLRKQKKNKKNKKYKNNK